MFLYLHVFISYKLLFFRLLGLVTIFPARNFLVRSLVIFWVFILKNKALKIDLQLCAYEWDWLQTSYSRLVWLGYILMEPFMSLSLGLFCSSSRFTMKELLDHFLNILVAEWGQKVEVLVLGHPLCIYLYNVPICNMTWCVLFSSQTLASLYSIKVNQLSVSKGMWCRVLK